MVKVWNCCVPCYFHVFALFLFSKMQSSLQIPWKSNLAFKILVMTTTYIKCMSDWICRSDHSLVSIPMTMYLQILKVFLEGRELNSGPCTCCKGVLLLELLCPSFVFVFFEIGCHSMMWPTWTMIFLFVLPQAAGVTGSHHFPQPLAEMGSHKLFAWAGYSLPPE
jgi:hypothetical protein